MGSVEKIKNFQKVNENIDTYLLSLLVWIFWQNEKMYFFYLDIGGQV